MNLNWRNMLQAAGMILLVCSGLGLIIRYIFSTDDDQSGDGNSD